MIPAFPCNITCIPLHVCMHTYTHSYACIKVYIRISVIWVHCCIKSSHPNFLLIHRQVEELDTRLFKDIGNGIFIHLQTCLMRCKRDIVTKKDQYSKLPLQTVPIRSTPRSKMNARREPTNERERWLYGAWDILAKEEQAKNKFATKRKSTFETDDPIEEIDDEALAALDIPFAVVVPTNLNTNSSIPSNISTPSSYVDCSLDTTSSLVIGPPPATRLGHATTNPHGSKRMRLGMDGVYDTPVQDTPKTMSSIEDSPTNTSTMTTVNLGTPAFIPCMLEAQESRDAFPIQGQTNLLPSPSVHSTQNTWLSPLHHASNASVQSSMPLSMSSCSSNSPDAVLRLSAHTTPVVLSVMDLVSIVHNLHSRTWEYTAKEIQKRKQYPPKQYIRPSDAGLSDNPTPLCPDGNILFEWFGKQLHKNEGISLLDLKRHPETKKQYEALSTRSRVLLELAIQKYRGLWLVQHVLQDDPTMEDAHLETTTKPIVVQEKIVVCVRGRVDAVRRVDDKIDQLIEIKTSVSKQPHPTHVTQLQLYMMCFHVHKGSILYRYDHKNHEMQVPFDRDFWSRTVVPRLVAFARANPSVFTSP